MNRVIISLLFVICSFAESKADWPVGKKRFTLAPSLTYTGSGRYFDTDGLIRKTPYGGSFSAYTFAFSNTHGLSRKVDLFYSIPFIYVSTKSSIASRQSTFGVGDITVGASYNTPSKDLRSYYTIKAALIFPAYSNLKQPYLGFGQKGVLFAANYSFIPKAGVYMILEGTYARYFDELDGPNQYGININYGIILPRFQTLSFAFNHLLSESADKTANLNPLINKDFMVGKLSCTYGRRLSRNVGLYVMGNHPVYGRNSGVALGISVFATIRLP
jgi:hypothetical protein